MPIYAYRCNDCGFEKDHLQKLADAPISVCPSCGASAYAKMVTAAGFQLKGTGWYATDFKSSGSKPGTAAKSDAAAGEASKSEAAKSDAAPAATSGCGTSCACH